MCTPPTPQANPLEAEILGTWVSSRGVLCPGLESTQSPTKGTVKGGRPLRPALLFYQQERSLEKSRDPPKPPSCPRKSPEADSPPVSLLLYFLLLSFLSFFNFICIADTTTDVLIVPPFAHLHTPRAPASLRPSRHLCVQGSGTCTCSPADPLTLFHPVSPALLTAVRLLHVSRPPFLLFCSVDSTWK